MLVTCNLLYAVVIDLNSTLNNFSEPPKASRKYKEAVLPEIEEHSDVLITHVVSPDEIYVQKVT